MAFTINVNYECADQEVQHCQSLRELDKVVQDKFRLLVEAEQDATSVVGTGNTTCIVDVSICSTLRGMFMFVQALPAPGRRALCCLLRSSARLLRSGSTGV